MVKLDDIIKGHINERDEASNHAYSRILRLAVDGLKDMHYDVSGVPVIVPLTIDTNTQTVNLPKDFIRHTRISVCINEQLFPLVENRDICLNRETDDCGEPQDRDMFNNVPIVAYPSFNVATKPYRAGEFTGGLYNVGGGSIFGYFRIDIANGWIQLQDVCQDYIVLEYLSKPAMIQGAYLVHEFVAQALNAYIYWASIRSKTTVGGGEKDRAERAYDKQKNRAKQQFNAPTLDGVYQAIYKNFRLSPKT